MEIFCPERVGSMRSVEDGAVSTDGMNLIDSRISRNDQNGPGVSNFDGSRVSARRDGGRACG